MLRFGARKIDKKILTFLKLPCGNTVDNLLVLAYKINSINIKGISNLICM
jgi:hypothetical protein